MDTVKEEFKEDGLVRKMGKTLSSFNFLDKLERSWLEFVTYSAYILRLENLS